MKTKNRWLYRVGAILASVFLSFSASVTPVFAAESGTGSSVDSGAYDGLSGIDQAKVAILTIPSFLKCACRATGAYFRGDADGMIAEAQNYLTSVDHLAQFKKYGYVKQGTSGTYYVTIPKDSTGIKIPSEMVNEAKIALDNVVLQHDGYYLITLCNPYSIPVSSFSSIDLYNSVVSSLNDGNIWYAKKSFYFYPFDSNSIFYLYTATKGDPFGLGVCRSDYSSYPSFNALHIADNQLSTITLGSPDCFSVASTPDFNYYNHLYHKGGGCIRMYNSITGAKNASIGNRSVYTSTYYNNMKTDNSVDNSQHIDNSQISIDSNNLTTTNSVSDSYNTSSTENITNNITNNNGISDEQLQQIIDAIQRNPSSGGTGSGSGGSGSGGSGSGGSSGGVTAIVDAIGKLLDVVAMIAGKVIAAFADFIASILKSLDSFTGLTDGFTKFLSGTFSFIPPEILTIIGTGVTISILVSIIKLIRR